MFFRLVLVRIKRAASRVVAKVRQGIAWIKLSSARIEQSRGYAYARDYFTPSNILSLSALVIAFVSLQVNWDMKAISQKQDSTSVSIDTFKILLLKTDKFISQQAELLAIYRQELDELKRLTGRADSNLGISSTHLELNKRDEKIKYLANCENLHGACYLMYHLSREYYMAERENQTALYYNLQQRLRILKAQKDVMERQTSNPALMNNGSLLNKWWVVYNYVLDRYTIDDIRFNSGYVIDSYGFASFNKVISRIDTIRAAASNYSIIEINRVKKEMKISNPTIR